MSSAVTRSTLTYVEGIFADLRVHYAGPDDGQGMNRLTYSPEELEAHDILAGHASELGMKPYRDIFGNTFAVMPGQDRGQGVAVIASHLDAVKNGGQFDGPAGVIMGLAAAKIMRDQGITPKQDLVVAAWVGEESPPFGRYALGSHMATGQAKEEWLQLTRFDTGMTVLEHAEALGHDIDKIKEAVARSHASLPIGRVGASFEGHIEQAKSLVRAGTPLGIVPSIRGNIRVPGNVWFAGIAGHSGAMPQEERFDAAFAAAEYTVRVRHKLQAIRDAGRDIVFHAPDLHVHNPKATTVADLAHVKLEVRSNDDSVLDEVRMIFADVAVEVAKENGVCVSTPLNGAAPFDETQLRAYRREGAQAIITVTQEAFPKLDPVFMDSAALGLLKHNADQLGIRYIDTPSGAGHDNGVLAAAGIPAAMMFFRQITGRSHVPDEDIDIDAYLAGIQVMAGAAQDISSVARPKSRGTETFEAALLSRGAIELRP